jgi:hypothetical protein
MFPMLLRFLLRLIVVPLGAAIAVMVAMAVIVFAHWRAVQALLGADPQAQQDYLFAFMEGGPVLAMLLSIWMVDMFVPAAAGVLISEAMAVRSWMFHAVNGGFSAWLGWTLTADIRDEYRFLSDPEALVAAGLAAGFAYWLIAGRTAGFWRPVRSPRAPQLGPPPSRPSPSRP